VKSLSGIEVAKGVIAILILLGALLNLLTTFGLLRLPDVYNRSHAATKAATLGTMSTLFGAFLYFWIMDGIVSAKLLLGIVFILVTLPVGGHLVGRSAYRTNTPLWEKSVQNDLAHLERKQAGE
jgi:multicomponent Na+:H+ antiporter subunit G